MHIGKNKVTCDLGQLEEFVTEGKVEKEEERTFVTEVDHKYPSFIWNEPNPPVAILYGHVSSPTSKRLHDFLKYEVLNELFIDLLILISLEH